MSSIQISRPIILCRFSARSAEAGDEEVLFYKYTKKMFTIRCLFHSQNKNKTKKLYNFAIVIINCTKVSFFFL